MSSPIVSSPTETQGPPVFVEQQRFLPYPLSLALLLLVVAFGIWTVILWGRLEASQWIPLIMGVGLTLLFHLLELTVTVRLSEIDIRFRPLTRRRFPCAAVRSCEARTYRPLRECGGWGVRRSWKGGWAYSVRGNRGVQLVLEDGTSILVGSQRADELAAAIQGSMELRPRRSEARAPEG